MVDHLRDASHTKSHTRHTTGHRFHDGVGQVVFKRGQHKHISSVVGSSHGMTATDCSESEGAYFYLVSNLLAVLADDSHGGSFGKLWRRGGQAVDGLNEERHALTLIVNTLCNEQDDAPLGGQAHVQTCLAAVGRSIDARVDGVRNVAHPLSYEQPALLRLRLKPSATGHKLNVGVVIQRLLLAPHLA